MERRRLTTHRHKNVTNRESLWRAFAIIAKWARTVGLGRLLYFIVKVLLWLIAIPTVLIVIACGHVVEWWTNEFNQRKEETHGKRKKRNATEVLTGFVIQTIMTQERLAQHFYNSVSKSKSNGSDNQNSSDNDTSDSDIMDGGNTKEIVQRRNSCPMTDSILLARQVSTEASTPMLNDYEVKIVPMFNRKSSGLKKFFVYVRTNSMDKFRKTLQSFQLRLRNDHCKEPPLPKFGAFSAFVFAMCTVIDIINTIKTIATRLQKKESEIPLFKRFSPPEVHGAVAWSDMIPLDLISKLEDKTHADVDAITTAILTMALKSYCQTMVGIVPDDVQALMLPGPMSVDYNEGSQITLPLYCNDKQDLMNKCSLRVKRSKLEQRENERRWNDFKLILPSNLLNLIKRYFYGTNPVIIQNIYIAEDVFNSQPMLTSTVQSIYRWLPCRGRSSLTATVMHLPNSLAFSIVADKKSIQSSTLLAECINTSVRWLAMTYEIRYDYHSPSATPPIFDQLN